MNEEDGRIYEADGMYIDAKVKAEHAIAQLVNQEDECMSRSGTNNMASVFYVRAKQLTAISGNKEILSDKKNRATIEVIIIIILVSFLLSIFELNLMYFFPFYI